TEYAAIKAVSFCLDAALLHHPLPLRHFLADEVAELGRAHLHDLCPFAGEVLLHLVGILHRGDLPVQLLDDGSGRAGGRPPTTPHQLTASERGTPASEMVGTSGSTGLRVKPPVPSARSLPERMCGVVCTSEENITLVWPPTTSTIAGPPPLNGTCRMLTPAISLNSSPPRCWKLPMPAESYCNWPGFSLAAAKSSCTECTGSSGLTTSTFAPEARRGTGVNALVGS